MATVGLIDYPKRDGGHPFDFPWQGNIKTGTPVEGDIPSGLNAFTATGEGIVRELFIAGGGCSPKEFADINIKILDADDAPIMSEVPLGSLCGMIYPLHSSGLGAVYNTKWWGVLNTDATNHVHGMKVRFPMPFTNGIKIVLNDYAFAVTGVYTYAVYQDELPNCWNRNYKLKSLFTTGNVAYNETRTFLDVAAGTSGVVVAESMGFVPASADATYLEANPHFHIDRATAVGYQWSGTEDGFGAAYYFGAGGAWTKDAAGTGITRNDMQMGDTEGATYVDHNSKSYSVYHIHEYDPVFFTDGILGHWTNDYAGSPTVALDCGTLWYEED